MTTVRSAATKTMQEAQRFLWLWFTGGLAVERWRGRLKSGISGGLTPSIRVLLGFR